MKKVSPLFIFSVISLAACSREHATHEETEETPSFSSQSESSSSSEIALQYKIVQIGLQWWFAENISDTPTDSAGNFWCYSNAESNCKKYGKLYDFETAKTICPSGWRLPSKEDFDALLDFVEKRDENIFAGAVLKSQEEWDDKGADLYGFTALPSGFRNHDGNFATLGKQAFFWTSTESGTQNAYHRNFRNDENLYSGLSDKQLGYSVRCVK